MFTLVANVIQYSMLIVRGVFLTASCIGQLIFTLTSSVTSAIWTIFENIILFLQILYEDNIFIVTDELPNVTKTIVNSVSDQLGQLVYCYEIALNNTYFKVNSTIKTIAWFTNAVCTIIVETLHLFKKTFILFGDTLWFILTFIPVQIPLLLKELFTDVSLWIKDLAVMSYVQFLGVTNFLSDVPLQSLMGISCAIIIIRLCVHYRENIHNQATVIYWSLTRKILYLCYAVYFNFTNPEVRMIARMAPLQQAEVAGVVPNDDEEALCVICKERQKCVLTLPCRHVCLCRSCCTRLYEYQRTCPICRTFIYHSVNIYL